MLRANNREHKKNCHRCVLKYILETDRLILREMTQDDYPSLATILQDEQTMYAYEGALSDAETQNWLDCQIERYMTDGFGLWAVVLKSSGDMIGQTGISWQDVDGERVPEIVYLFNRAYWHNGYATEAAIACKEYAFNTLGFKEIYSIVRSTNIASKNVAIRNGMIIRNRIVRHFRGIDMSHFVLSATNPPRLLRMDEFFTTQAPAYDEYMLNNVAGYSKGCAELAKHIPAQTKTLLDLGCGTGLELEEIFKLYPDVQVTGVDMTQAMLDKLSEKYSDKQITLICASYFDVDFGCEQYDRVISFEAMHHLAHEEKATLYARIFKAIKPGGAYVEGDYMFSTQAEEDALFAKKMGDYAAQEIFDRELYHFDTPCTVENQIKTLTTAGFADVKKVYREGNTTIIVAQKAVEHSEAGSYVL